MCIHMDIMNNSVHMNNMNRLTMINMVIVHGITNRSFMNTVKIIIIHIVTCLFQAIVNWAVQYKS
jgi:hypothetical protein